MQKHIANIFTHKKFVLKWIFVSYLLAMHKRSIMDAIIKDIIDDARPMVTKDMARRGYAKLGITKKPNCINDVYRIFRIVS